MTTLFVKRLTVIDNSILSASRGLIGESWQVDMELDGDLDHQGMVLDFGDVKRLLKRLIDEQFDHKLLVPADYPGLTHTELPRGLHLSFVTDDGGVIEHRSPHDAVRLIPCERIVADRLAQIIADYLSPQTPDNVSAVRVRLWPENTPGAYYHYSHGLKRHDGNCQRIAHGHRSRLEILRNGQRDNALEDEWATRWTDIYIGTRDDIIGSSERDGFDYWEFGYDSAQGSFGLTLPKSRCYLIDSDSTVENIAQHIAEVLKAEYPDDRFKVYAYEGVDKGAIGVA
ncbi:MAG: 6-carboxytetrahydropterin synthase [Gammaproteobacteria bacterium]|nr:6-carboxytetrahydropterin synthase [Gammaproteobacteria bacterium]